MVGNGAYVFFITVVETQCSKLIVKCGIASGGAIGAEVTVDKNW